MSRGFVHLSGRLFVLKLGDMDIFYQNNADAQLPPGFRFHPTDEELITYYLLKKVLDHDFTSRAIAQVDLNKSEPWNLPGN